ncbi:MAG: YcnI family protein [Actinomycetota bacterium]
MKILVRAGLAGILVPLFAAPAVAHITVQPPEAVIGSFSRFVVRVPNEEADAATIKVKVALPPLAFVSFEPKEGWKRTVEMRTLDEPIVVFGNEVTEVVGTVTWSQGSIDVGEFDEFGFSARMPDEETSVEFRAFQTYDSGKVVEWVGTPDSDEPAPLLTTYDIGAEEEEGQLAVLARLTDQIASGGEDDDDGGSSLATLLGGTGTILGAAALAVALKRRAA